MSLTIIYPKLRDGVFQRTLFIAPDTAAIISNSVNRNSTEMLNLHIECRDALYALIEEYERYLSLCRPLMNICSSVNAARYFEKHTNFAANKAPSILISPTPSLMTMPEEIALSISNRCAAPLFYSLWKKSSEAFEASLSTPFSEFLTHQVDVNADTIEIPTADMFRTDSLYYTKKEYILHMQHILELTKTHPDYFFSHIRFAQPNIMIWGKEDVGVPLARTDCPSMVFTFSEQNITAAFWAYLKTVSDLL